MPVSFGMVFSEFHQAVIPGYTIEPAFEVADFKARDIGNQGFKNLHYRILAVVAVFQVFHAHPVNQVHIPFIKHPQHFQVRFFPVQVYQFRVGEEGMVMWGGGQKYVYYNPAWRSPHPLPLS